MGQNFDQVKRDKTFRSMPNILNGSVPDQTSKNGYVACANNQVMLLFVTLQYLKPSQNKKGQKIL